MVDYNNFNIIYLTNVGNRSRIVLLAVISSISSCFPKRPVRLILTWFPQKLSSRKEGSYSP